MIKNTFTLSPENFSRETDHFPSSSVCNSEWIGKNKGVQLRMHQEKENSSAFPCIECMITFFFFLVDRDMLNWYKTHRQNIVNTIFYPPAQTINQLRQLNTVRKVSRTKINVILRTKFNCNILIETNRANHFMGFWDIPVSCFKKPHQRVSRISLVHILGSPDKTYVTT